MMKNLPLVLLVAFLGGLIGAWAFVQFTPATIIAKESTYDRVMRTQTIRCGYMAWPPFLTKDPNNGQLSGIVYEYTEALGKALHLKIDWAEETGLSDFIPGLSMGRFDAMCLTAWPTATRAREIDFVTPIYYSAFYAYARMDDQRFDNTLDKIDDASVIITAIDGEMGSIIAANDFPKAKTLQLPQISSPAELFTTVASNKADIVLADPSSFAKYDSNNAGKIRRIPSAEPIRIFGNALAIAQGQDKFRRMLDTATDELLSSGQIEKILVKYEQTPDLLLRVAPPYRNQL